MARVFVQACRSLSLRDEESLVMVLERLPSLAALLGDRTRLSGNSIWNVLLGTMPCGLLQGLDIGPASITAFKDALEQCKTVVWNGPMGVFEFDKFANGTIVSTWHMGLNL